MFKFPYTNFEKINLDWIMQKIKALEPAVDMVAQADAALKLANETSAEALRVAGEADDAVTSVTAQAAAAVQTANEAKTIAEQAAAATIPDGTIAKAKLVTSLQEQIDANTTNAGNALLAAGGASNTATNAQNTANNAQSTATNALNIATDANSTAGDALAIANQALAASGGGAWTLAGNSTGSAITVPSGAKELLFVAYLTGYGSYKGTAILPMNAVGAGGLLVQIPIAIALGSISMCGIWVTPSTAAPHNTDPTIGCYFQMFYR